MMLLLWVLCLPWVLSAAKKCEYNQSPLTVSPQLNSLQCYNDYKSYFHCTWREETERRPHRSLQLWFYTALSLNPNKTTRVCEDYPSAVDGIRECRYYTTVFAPGFDYMAFFMDPLKSCSSIDSKSEDLSLLLRARKPDDLTTSNTGDGGSLITWSSPYPQSSALNDNITYQVDYRPRGRHNWTTEELNDTEMRLEKKKLIPGHGYEARVRARVALGHWSHWSPTVSWHTPPDPEQAPRVDCVLWGEREARCSWEQSIELGHFISYQLVCRLKHTAAWQECCKDPEVSRGHRADTVELSCLLPLTTPSTSTLQVELVPTHNAKMFRATKHIRPYPPTQVNVTEKASIWVVEWTPAEIRDAALRHEVRYYSQPNEEDAETLNIDSGHSSANILGSSLVPFRKYWVKVRSLVVETDEYEGTPSDWSSPPAEWTPQAATRPYWICAFVVVFVVLIVLFIFPACRRRFAEWEESLPSPDKSRVILDVQAAKTLGILVSEKTYLCKVMDMDSMSTCSTIVSDCPKKGLDIQIDEAVDEGIWNCDKSAISLNGPYIFFQPMDSKTVKEDMCEQTEAFCPVPVMIAPSDEEYVRLPSPTVSSSTQDLSYNHSSSDGQNNTNTEEEQHCLRDDYVAEAFCPQGGIIQSSGYLQLPTDTDTARELS